MPAFDPSLTAPHDPAGWGRWLIGHHLEHKQMEAAAFALTPSVSIPDYALLSWSDDPLFVSGWLNSHSQVHVALRIPGAISGIDLSEVDLTNDGEFLEWQNDHATEHQVLRSFYGLA